MYWKYASPYIPSIINFYNNAQPLYIEKILFTLCQFQERRHHEVLSRNGIPASATSRRRENYSFSNSEIFASWFLLALDGLFLVPVFCFFLYMIKTIFIELYRRGTERSWILLRNWNAMSGDSAMWVLTHIQQGLVWNIFQLPIEGDENAIFTSVTQHG